MARESAVFSGASGSTAGARAGIASLRRRMRAVTGSSAEVRRLPVRSGVASMVCSAFSALI